MELVKISNSVFEQNPELLSIWEGELSESFVEATEAFVNGLDDLGEIFLIKKQNELIGITGYWPLDTLVKSVGLRWHGIVKEKRGNNYGHESLLNLIEYLRLIGFEKIYEITYKDDTEKYFLDIGFSEVYDEDIKNLVYLSSGADGKKLLVYNIGGMI